MKTLLCFAHGLLTDYDRLLGNTERHGIDVISLGKEGEASYGTAFTTFLMFLLYRYGDEFTKKLYTILALYGEKYLEEYDGEDPDLKYLFNLNRQDLKQYPNQKLQLFARGDSIHDYDLGAQIDFENFDFKCIYSDAGSRFTVSIYSCLSTGIFVFEDFGLKKTEIRMIAPMGLLNVEKKETIKTIEQFSTTRRRTLRQILDQYNSIYPRGQRVLFLVSCRTRSEEMMVLEDQLQKRSCLVKLMQKLSIK